MFFDISELTKKTQEKISVKLDIKGEDFYFNGDLIQYSKPISIEGSFCTKGSLIEFESNLKTEITLSCSRCLERYNYPLDIEILENFTQEEIEDDDEIIKIDGSTVDLMRVCEDNILLAIPCKALCTENCKGLCQKCGINSNYSSCACEKDDVDPRLEKLKNFFSANKEV